MIPIHKPDLGKEEAQAAARAIHSGWVTQGPEVERFERAVADYCGAAEAVATASGTTALHLGLLTLGIGPGDEVVCPSLSFIATAGAICHAGADPVFADVDPRTYNLDPDAAEAAVTPRTRAIMVVHQMGLPADIDRFLAIGRRRNVMIIEDAACALGSRYRDEPIGGHTALACFSFHPRKVITTGEGGMVVTNDRRLADRLRRLRNHGLGATAGLPSSAEDRVTWPHERGHARNSEVMSTTSVDMAPAQNYGHNSMVPRCDQLGYNFRMSDIHAAIGLAQMAKLEGILRRRRELAARYAAALAEHLYVRPPWTPDYAMPNFQSYALGLTDGTPIERDELVAWLRKRGIGAAPGIMLAHRQPVHARRAGANRLPKSEAAHRRSLLLPLYPQLTESQQDRIVELLWEAFSLVPRGVAHGC
jgi:dTDP-4-amino-4,6-dideoxygalactose transaminase